MRADSEAGNEREAETSGDCLDLLAGVSRDELRAQLSRILTAKCFAQSLRLQHFLRYIVEKALAGQRDQLKEYVIGVEVFTRGPSFDPRLDTVVRVEARRLRFKLAEYYQTEGRSDTVEILLPKGGYAPVLRLRAFPQNKSPSSHPAMSRLLGSWKILLAVSVLLGGILAYRLWFPGPAKPGPTMPHPAIAVLPFENLSADPEQSYFSEGMTDALITDLAKIDALRVISRTSGLAYKDSGKPLQEIATELGVQYVVEGTVQRRANRVRITAQLLAVSPERHLWAETYERDLGDVFALQGELAQAIARRINVRLTPGEQGRLTAQRAVHPGAYEAYLKGRHHWNQRTSESLRESLKYFHQAIDKEPSYALAHAGLADAYLMLGNYSEMPTAEAFPLAKAAARRALDLDGALGQAYATLSAISADYDWDWKESNRLSQRAIELDPSYSTAYQWYGQHLACQGRFEEGLSSVQRARELDPLSPVMNSTLGTVLYLGRRYDEAIEQFRRTLELDQSFVGAHFHLGLAYLHKGLHTEALQEVQRARDLAPSNLELLSFLAYAHALTGNRPEALKLLQELFGLAERRHVSPLLFAIPYLGLGDSAQALDWLEKAVEARAGFLETAKVDPIFDSLRTNPRFAILLKRLNLTE